MAEKEIKKMIGKVFNDIADAIETGQFGQRPRIGITTLGSEHGIENIIQGAEEAQKNNDIEVVLIGPKTKTKLKTKEANTEQEVHKKMEELLDNNEIDSAVTMHYSFPIGVSTVGKVITPGKGKEMYVATTTGTSSTDRVEGMVKNAIYGIITAKACGVENPSVGILNIDGARQTERALKELSQRGYKINFSESLRADGGCVMRGNDLLTGTPDVMVTDPLTGNLLMKVFSSYSTGGSYEALGYGYGPGIGEDYDKIILILSRASGKPVVSGAIQYAAQLIKGNCKEIAKEEFQKANKAGLKEILEGLKTKKENVEEEITKPEKEVVTGQIAGIEIMDLEDAVKALWKHGIYAESGMGCTGPIVLVNEEKLKTAMKILVEAEFVAKEKIDC